VFVQVRCTVHGGYVRTVPGSFLHMFGVCERCAPKEKENS
jgi:hypothetical protein